MAVAKHEGRISTRSATPAGIYSLALSTLLITTAAARAQGEAEQAGQAEQAEQPEQEAAGEAQAEAPVSAALLEARERVGRGEALFEQGNYDAALVEFEAAHDLLDGHPMQYFVLYNIGQCYEQLFRYDRAMLYYRRYLEEGGAEGEDAPEVRAKVGLLEGLLGTIQISVSSEDAEVPLETYEVWVDERLVGSDTEQVMVPGGNHVVQIRSEGFVSAQREVQLPARAERSLRFTLEPLAEQFEGAHPAFFWASAGAALISLAVGGVFGLQAISTSNEVEEALDAGGTRALRDATEAQREEIARLSLTADIFFGAAALFGVGAVVLAFLTDFGGQEESPSAVARLRLVPSLWAEGGGLSLDLRF
ncbi:MAG: tetratricopeptide repeat protein [Myxococcales bacterium]|nr:tetratricopeptide repeat protein [Myxococcales bacterium]